MYQDLHYVPDVVMRKMQKGRRKKKHICNKLDDTEKGYINDMYDFDDFN
jgi:hypothetical protein